MFRGLVAFLALQMAVAGFAMAAAAPEQVQGLYEGACKIAGVQQNLEARVVALKDGYKVLIRQAGADGKVAKVELKGTAEKLEGQAGNVAWTGSYADGAIKGTCGDGTFQIAKVQRKSPTLGAKPPAGAIVLLDGKNFDELTKGKLKDGSEQQWKITEDGAIEVPKGGMRSSKAITGSFKMHVEFKCPLMPAAEGQGRGNSGCYLPNGDEIQVLDSFGMTTYQGGGCGGLYRYKDPDAFDEFSLASLPPLEWQTYDIEYTVRKEDGKLVGKPRVTVFHNGIRIHDNVELSRDAKPGTLHWQDHGNPVQYRNIWVLPIDQ